MSDLGYLGLPLPAINADDNQWGQKISDVLEAVDAELSDIDTRLDDIDTKVEKTGVAPAGTAQCDITFGSAKTYGWCRVRISVRFEPSANLQAAFTYADMYINNATAGGQSTIAQIHNGSAGNFVVATTDFVVTRPSDRVIRITYTNNNVVSNNAIEFGVLSATNLSAVTVT